MEQFPQYTKINKREITWLDFREWSNIEKIPEQVIKENAQQ